MKSAAFNSMLSQALTTPEATVTTYARRLKEAGLLTTGARGRNAPEMTSLDAARMTLAILSSDGPVHCVERVQRFGQLKYSAGFNRALRGYETIQPDEFEHLFHGENLEEVLAHLFSLPSVLGLEAAAAWFNENTFHLRVFDFDILAELFRWKLESDGTLRELVVPFKGERMTLTDKGFAHIEGFTPIKGGVRTERSISGSSFLSIGVALTLTDQEAT